MKPLFLSLLLVASTAFPTIATSNSLDIDPVYQQTPVWCWAAVGEMVFKYYNIGSINPGGFYQCGIVALLHPTCNVDCRNCVVGAGNSRTMRRMLERYPEVARGQMLTSSRISTSYRSREVSLRTVKAEIDNGRPVIAGISPSGYQRDGVSEHVALIVGYDEDNLIVNDPFPFSSGAFRGNPYEDAGGSREYRGQYYISYDDFVSSLNWGETFYKIKCRGSTCPSFGDNDDTGDWRREPCNRIAGCGAY